MILAGLINPDLYVRVPLKVFNEEIVGGEETLQPLPVYHDCRALTGGVSTTSTATTSALLTEDYLKYGGSWSDFKMHYSGLLLHGNDTQWLVSSHQAALLYITKTRTAGLVISTYY